MGKVVKPSWEAPRPNDSFHSPQSIAEFKSTLKTSLIRKYTGMAESMWEWDFSTSPQFEDFSLMTRHTEPETTLMRSGQGVFFEVPSTGQWAFLPVVYEGGINIYGKFNSWHPMPVGYQEGDRGKDPVRDTIRNLSLDATNSVLMLDNLYGQSDKQLVEQAVNALVDNCLTISQLQLLMKAPYIIRCTDSNINDAKQLYLSISSDSPAIFRYGDVEGPEAVVESTGTSIDPSLFDTFRHWENILLEQLGIPGAQVTQKRTVQTEDEINMADDMITLRRQEKFRMRQLAVERLNELAGSSVTVTSVIDARKDNVERSGEDEGEDEGGEDNVQ